MAFQCFGWFYVAAAFKDKENGFGFDWIEEAAYRACRSMSDFAQTLRMVTSMGLDDQYPTTFEELLIFAREFWVPDTAPAL